ncbi:MAG: accessory factor UbiK family protein [Rhodobacteraceae bacterium]|nr:accessory factor UbiK family protein [Paracoccaceae bacterium]
MQTKGKLFEDLAQLMTNAMGVAHEARGEFETAFDSWFDRWAASRNFIRRDEFEAVRLMAEKARQENDSLRRRIEQLETAARKPAARKRAAKPSVTKQK